MRALAGRPEALRFRPGVEQVEDRTVPTPVVTISSVTSVQEGMPYTAVATLSRTDPPIGPLTVNLGYSGTATAGSDYSGQPATVTFNSGATTAPFTFTILDDSVSEPTETIVIAVEPGTGYAVGTPDTATVNLLDNDAQVVTVASPFGAAEGGVNGKFQFTRTGDLSSSLTANYTTGGTATSGTDYTALSGSVTFAANSATADVDVAATDDNVYDPDETVSVTVGSGTGYSVGTPDSAELTIRDSVNMTFTLNSYVGSVKYEIPWDQVDPSQATQSLTPTSFSLNIGGQNFAYGSANYTSGPALLFQYGDLVGLQFDLDLTGTGSAFASISLSNGVATGVDALTQLVYTDNAPVDTGPATLLLDFSTINLPTSGSTKYSMEVTTADGKHKSVEVEVFAGATKSQVRDLFESALKGVGIGAKAKGTTGLEIGGSATSELTRVHLTGGFGSADPKLIGRTKDGNGTYPTYDP